jgi:hypothetical protein
MCVAELLEWAAAHDLGGQLETLNLASNEIHLGGARRLLLACRALPSLTRVSLAHNPCVVMDDARDALAAELGEGCLVRGVWRRDLDTNGEATFERESRAKRHSSFASDTEEGASRRGSSTSRKSSVKMHDTIAGHGDDLLAQQVSKSGSVHDKSKLRASIGGSMWGSGTR